MRIPQSAAFVTLVAAAFAAAPSYASTISYTSFSDTTGLTLKGSAAKESTVQDGAVLRLTSDNFNQAGAAYSSTSLQLGNNATFSTSFQFRMSHTGDIPADGLAFVLAASTNGLGGAGIGMGYQGVPNSFAIEFDTYDNGYYDGYSNNQIGIGINGGYATQAVTTVYGKQQCAWTTSGANLAGCMANGDLWTVNIGYDGTKLNMTMQDGAGAQFVALKDYAVDIRALLGADLAYAGFTAATGSKSSTHDIVNWTFANTAQLPAEVPEPGSAWILGLGLAGLAARRRKKA